MDSPTIVAVCNQKGGVGKTTTAVNLAAGLALQGHRTLLVDLDIQGSASATLGRSPSEGAVDVARVLLEDRPLDEAVISTAVEGLSLAPAGERMALVDLHLASAYGRERALERALRGPRVRDHAFVVIDTAPYLGLLTVNAILACDQVLVPVSCEYLPMLGLKLLEQTLEQLRSRAGARAGVLGYLLTMVDRRERITTEVEEILRGRFGEAVFRTVVRANTHHKAAPSFRRTIFEHEPSGGKGREDYEALTAEVLSRLGKAPGVKTAARRPRVRKATPSGEGIVVRPLARAGS
ncbi:MAG: ParA family protein [Deltaproteobacteria bacterium]|nr:ParA family protein [Deltaproteobacteria bacterium]